MTIAYIKNADGTGGLVQNTFRDTAGVLHVLLSDYFTDSAGLQHLVFRDDLFIIPTGTSRQVFHVTASPRRFTATDKRNFIA